MSLNKFYKGFLVLLAFGFGVNYWLKQTKNPGLPFSEIKLADQTGKVFLGVMWKGKYVLVSYFQSWCGDCARELPSIQKLQDKVGSEKISIVLISDEPFLKINKFKNQFHSDLPFFQSVQPFKEIGVGVYPTTYLIGPDGKMILRRLEGYDWASPEVLQLIK